MTLTPQTRRAPRRGSGFTLVELLVTIGVLLVLLGILMPAILSMRRSADRKRTELDFQAISQALEAYKQVFNDYPRQIRPDWNVTQPARLTTGPERVLAKYLLGWDPAPGQQSVDGQGVRVVKNLNNKAAANNAKKWGPYLPPDRFKVPQPGVGDLDDPNNNSEGGQLMDRYGSEIQYYPKWNPRVDLTQRGSIVGVVTRPTSTSTTRAMFNIYDGIAYKNTAHLDHLLYVLGDGPDAVSAATPPAQLPPLTTTETAGFPNNKLDPGVPDPAEAGKWKVPPEQLSFTGEFILVSAGPDKAWGLNDFYDPSNTDKGSANRKRSKVDDIYNFERK